MDKSSKELFEKVKITFELRNREERPTRQEIVEYVMVSNLLMEYQIKEYVEGNFDLSMQGFFNKLGKDLTKQDEN